MNKSPNKLIYLFFSLLLSKDIWRAFLGIVLAVISAPGICQTREDIGLAGRVVVWIMIMTLGWAVAVLPADKISKTLQNCVKNLYKNTPYRY